MLLIRFIEIISRIVRGRHRKNRFLIIAPLLCLVCASCSLETKESSALNGIIDKQAQLDRTIGSLTQAGKYKEAVIPAEEKLSLVDQFNSQNPDLRVRVRANSAVLNSTASINYRTGNIDRAVALYKRAIEAEETANVLNVENIATSAEGLASIYEGQGRESDAEAVYLDVLKWYVSAGGNLDNAALLPLYAKLADFYVTTGDYDKAEQYYSKALKDGQLKIDYAQKMLTQTVALAGNSFYSNPSVKTSLDVPNRMVDQTTHVAGNLAFVYFKQGRFDKIKELYEGTVEGWEKYLSSNSSSSNPHLNFDKGLIPLLNKIAELTQHWDPTFAQGLFIKVARADQKMGEVNQLMSMDALRVNFHRNSFRYANNFISDTAQNRLNDNQAVINTFEMWANYKGSVAEFETRLLYAVKTSDNSELKKKYREYKHVVETIAETVLTDNNISAEAYLRERGMKMGLELELGRMVAPYMKDDAVKIDQVFSSLPRSSVYIDFAKIDMFDFKDQEFKGEKYYAFVIDSATKTVKLIEIGKAENIDSLIAAYHRAIDGYIASVATSRSVKIVGKAPVAGENEMDLSRITVALYDAIMKPVVPHISGKAQIIISPDGQLQLIPFEVLAPYGGKYMVQSYTISYVTDAKDMLRISSVSKLTGKAVIFADPDFDMPIGRSRNGQRAPKELQGLTFPRLTDTKVEADSIERILKLKLGMKIADYQGGRATEEALLNLNSPKILHLATHGYFLKDIKLNVADGGDVTWVKNAEEPMLRSGIVLAGSNTALKEGGDYGMVSSSKIVGMDLKNTEIVVLSACDTGVGDIEKADSVYGLKKAFLLAGAKSLLASLWSVPSAETTEMMTTFYSLVAQGKSKAEALRSAKLQIMEKKSAPFFWGAFVLSGNPY